MGDKDNLFDGMGKLVKMGVGAVADAVEKGVGYVNEVTTEGTEANKRASQIGENFAKKGEELFGKTTEFGNQIKDKVKNVMSGSVDYDAVMAALDNMSTAELKAVKVKLEALIALRPSECDNPFEQKQDDAQ